MVGLAYASQDLLGSTATVVAGGAATANGTLSITIAASRVYELANTDTASVAGGILTADTTQILQQGYAASQSIVLTTAALAAGQSQWVLIEAGFTQTDAIRPSDPTSGLLNFYNSTNPSQPLQGQGGNGQALSTVRQGVCTLRAVYGTPATTGSEVPPSADANYVGLYLIDLAYGQTVVNQGNILTAAPSVGTGVPNNYPVAPLLAGLLQSHHSGKAGQAPQVNLASEVQGRMAYANLPLFGTVAPAATTSRNFVASDAWNLVLRTNSGTLMTDTIPGTGLGILAAGTRIRFQNHDATALYVATVASGATLDGVAAGFIVLGPGQRAEILSDGSNYWIIDKPARIKLGANSNFYCNQASGNDALPGLAAGASAFQTLQAMVNFLANNVDGGGFTPNMNATGAFTTGINSQTPFFGSAGMSLSFASGSSVAATLASCFNASGAGCGFTVTSSGTAVVLTATGTATGQGSAFLATAGAILTAGVVNYGTCGSAHNSAGAFGRIIFTGDPVTISGGATSHLTANQGGELQYLLTKTVTLTGTPAFSTAFVTGTGSGAHIDCPSGSVTFSGAATGTRYSIAMNSTVQTGGGGASYFPGNAAGSTATGAQYA